MSPVAVFLRLLVLIPTRDFWGSIGFTLLRIGGGFFLSVVLGVFSAVLAARVRWISALLDPLMAVIKATPVASITILILIWVPSRNLSLTLSVLMVLPIFYSNVAQGIADTDRALLEMAQVFRLSRRRRLRFIYLPAVLPYFRTAAGLAMGLCWKAGVAAEVIGIPAGSVGERLYQAKIYLNTADVFAWTLVVILLNALFERLFFKLLALLPLNPQDFGPFSQAPGSEKKS